MFKKKFLSYLNQKFDGQMTAAAQASVEMLQYSIKENLAKILLLTIVMILAQVANYFWGNGAFSKPVFASLVVLAWIALIFKWGYFVKNEITELAERVNS